MINELSILKNMEYVRTGGSSQELKCAKYIQSELKKLGLKSTIEEFPVQAASISKCSLQVTKPYKEKINCLGYLNASSTKGLTKQLYYLRNTDNKVDLKNVKDKIVLLDKAGLGYWTFNDLINNGAAGFITITGELHEPNEDIDQKELRGTLRNLGSLPGVGINIKDMEKLIDSGAQEVKLILEQKEIKNVKSRNVVCNIKGEDDRTIIFTAHYDSTPLSKGVYDNATGSVGILKVAEYFATHKPKHNLIFVWCGSEERGLLGSKAYVKKHQKQLDKIDLCINLDMIGSKFGEFLCCVSGEDKLVNYVDYFASIKGFACRAYSGVYSSDSTPFADKGVPSLSFARMTHITPIHCRYDDFSTISKDAIKEDVKFILEFAEVMANSVVIPVERTIPDSIKEKLDYYLFRKRKKN